MNKTFLNWLEIKIRRVLIDFFVVDFGFQIFQFSISHLQICFVVVVEDSRGKPLLENMLILGTRKRSLFVLT